MNEFIFLLQTIIIAISCLIALRLSKEALVALICLFGVLSNIFVVKQIQLFGLYATAADAFSVGVLLGLNLLQEYFGKKIAKKAVWACFFSLLFYTIISQIHLWFSPSIFDATNGSFFNILQFAPRITIASLLVYFAVQQLDRYFYGILKDRFGNRYLLSRNYALLITSQLIDTVLFGFLGLYGIVNNITHVIAMSYAVKLAAIAIATPFVKYAKKMLSPTSSNDY